MSRTQGDCRGDSLGGFIGTIGGRRVPPLARPTSTAKGAITLDLYWSDWLLRDGIANWLAGLQTATSRPVIYLPPTYLCACAIEM